MMRRLDFIFFDAGGGHRAAANALLETIRRQSRPWDVRLVNLQELLEPLDVFRKLTGLRLQDLYNLMLRKGWTLGSPQLTWGMHLVIRLFHRQQVLALRDFWESSRPDLVVSVVPNFNRALGESLAAVLPGSPLLTVLTDLADYPPHFWLEPVPQYIACGTGHAVRQALALGHSRERIRLVSGMILHPRFYDIAPLDAGQRSAARAALGFDPSRPVGLVMFGGHGSAAMLDIAARLGDRQLIVVCGHNDALAARLRALRRAAPLHVEGFTAEVPRYMQLADYFIGKPGPGSISEALYMRLPVIVESNAWTLPQERFNPVWIREQAVGIVLPSFRRIAGAVDELLQADRYERCRAAAEALNNRAVFEVVDWMGELLG